MSNRNPTSEIKDSAVELMHAIISNYSEIRTKVKEAHIRKVMQIPLWIYSEANGALNAKYISKNAKWLIQSRGERFQSGLRHEHYIPRKILTNYLLNNVTNFQDKNNLTNFLEKLCCGAVLTVEEMKKVDVQYKSSLPENIDIENWEKCEDICLSRYKACGIDVVENAKYQ